MSPRPAAEEAEVDAAAGFRALKLKLGGRDVAEELEVIRAVRGAAPELMVDYNQSLSVASALGRVAELDRAGLRWIEEPTRADDFEGHARIAAAFETPIQLGENFSQPDEVERSAAAGASDELMLDAMRIGGVSGWLRAAGASRLPLSSHAFPEVSAHLLALAPRPGWLEWHDYAAPLLAAPLELRSGQVTARQRPGSG